jgi:four helix bundle protein
VALDFAEGALRAAAVFPTGYRHLCDQLKRASAAVPLHIAEGACRRTAREKANRYSLARGEAAESTAIIEIAVRLELIETREADRLADLAVRLVAMTTRLSARAR